MSLRYKTGFKAGFTLLEMSIVLVIISVVAVGAMVVFTETLAVRQVNETNAKLAAIQTAIYNFRLQNNRLPCPADVTLDISSSAKFGLESVNAGDCSTGSTYVSGARTAAAAPGPTVNFIQFPAVGAQDAREGMVPVRSLKLADDYAFDGWGRRIMYAVAMDMTQTNAMGLVSASDPTTRMTIKDSVGAVNTNQAAYVLLSFGPNGHGSYPRYGGSTRLNVGSINTDEQQNCNCDVNANNTGLSGIFVQKDPTENSASYFNSFDDIVVYATRIDMSLPTSLNLNVSGSTSNILCAQANFACSTHGTIKTCTCNQ